MRSRPLWALLLVAGSTVACGPGACAFGVDHSGSPPGGPLRVSAAVSLTDALTPIARKWEAAGNVHVELNFAASNVLARQILEGAPVDVFISADEAQMNRLVEAGAAGRTDVMPLLMNQLVVVTPAGRPVNGTLPSALADDAVKRIAIGDPQGVFYGNGYINHPDHRAAAQAALYAVFPSSETRLIFTDLLAEGHEPHKVRRVYVHGAEKADTWVDVTETMDVKLAALRKHVSQLGEWDPEKMLREWAGEEAKDKGFKYAEAYKVMVNEEEQSET